MSDEGGFAIVAISTRQKQDGIITVVDDY